jgi:hypothetical protein
MGQRTYQEGRAEEKTKTPSVFTCIHTHFLHYYYSIKSSFFIIYFFEKQKLDCSRTTSITDVRDFMGNHITSDYHIKNI